MTKANHLFISYRHDDGGHAGRLYDHLKRAFSAPAVYYDTARLEGGNDYRAELDRAVRTARACLAVVGQHWLSESNRARLHGGEEDVLRNELLTALECAAADARYGLVQVLAGGAQPLATTDLPPALGGLSNRQAHRLYDEYYEHCVEELIDLLERKYGMRRRTGITETMQLADLPDDPAQLAGLLALISRKLQAGTTPEARDPQ
ncbi:MAG: toll/interleukin-1 receptor domain-containing protein [Rhodocyclales bacterium]|nr:toll/interleukin-1 receptor domain-containing protein [Rhodocyclales bacterium]